VAKGVSGGRPWIAGHRLRRIAEPGSVTYSLAFVFYIAAMLLFFGDLGQSFLSLIRAQPLASVGDLVVALAGWWVCAGVAIRLGVAPTVFFSRLGAFLDR